MNLPTKMRLARRENHTLGLPGKISKKLIIFLVLLAVVIFIGLYTLSQGTISKGTELNLRINKLSGWHGQVKYFLYKTGKLPQSLYEASFFEDSWPRFIKVSVPQNFDMGKDGARLSDPNYFFKEVEYTLAVSQSGWFIIELKPGVRYPYRLMVDDKEQFMELRPVKAPEIPK